MTTRSRLLPALLLALLSISLNSCGNSEAIRLRYEAEKALHQAEKQLEDTGIKPELVDPQMRKAIAASFAHVVQLCYRSLNSVDSLRSPVEYRELQILAFRSSTRLSQLNYAAKRFDTCVAILNEFLTHVKPGGSAALATYVNLGQALQASRHWDSALVVYNYAVQNFYPPADDSGEVMLSLFSLPAHIYRVTEISGDSLAARQKFADAERYYSGLISGYPNTRLAVASRAMLSRLYDQTGQWEKALAQMQLVAESPPADQKSAPGRSGSSANLAVRLRIADVYAARMKDFAQAIRLYNEILDSLGPDDSLSRALVMFKISLVDMEQGRYAEARQKLIDLKENYPRFYVGTPMAQYAMARSFELEGNWNRAEIEYTFLIQHYRGSDEAMSTYLYVANLLDKQGRAPEAARWYREAEQYFDEAAAQGAGTIGEAKALAFKADLYYQKKEWPKAAEILLTLFEKCPQSDPGRRALLKASAIYRNILKEPARADSLIEVLKASFSEVAEEW
ncbi:MAG TPA: tetratricopeptide repeat protein [Candidatus Deferrimicrobium sp.]|nr:tetratricopeptide repeat protein [Candidatus Deferrimicrobium sp.]